MDGPVISFDVSKGESHCRGFEASGKPFSSAFCFPHDRGGFDKLRKLATEIENATGRKPAAVLESTGVYGMTLLSFLTAEKAETYLISPLESAKMRKSEVRPTKNDSLDCTTIAKVYYSKALRRYEQEGRIYSDLREMSRNYRYILGLITAEKNRYQRCLDLVWPGFCDVIDYASDSSLSVVIGLRHPSLVRTSRGVIKAIGTHRPRRISADDLADRVVAYSKSHVSGVSPDSYAVRETAESAERLAELKKTVASLLEEMEELASMLPGYALLKTVPAVSDISAVRLMAEIGDIGRFKDGKSLVAYAGIDPMVLQSGKSTGQHLHITKKGNAFLRCTLYLIVTNIVKFSPECKIAEYVRKKKSDGRPYKASVVAGCSKLARILFSMLTKNMPYSE